MKNLIYECKLNDMHILVLTEVRDQLSDKLPVLAEIKQTGRISVLIQISQALLDIREVINLSHRNDLKWTSYALNMSLLKLTMSHEVLKCIPDYKFKSLRETVYSSIITINRIIVETHPDNQELDFSELFG